MKYLRIYADVSGESHFEDVNIKLTQTDFAPPAPPLTSLHSTRLRSMLFAFSLLAGGAIGILCQSDKFSSFSLARSKGRQAMGRCDNSEKGTSCFVRTPQAKDI
jgi:hypothetical protein